MFFTLLLLGFLSFSPGNGLKSSDFVRRIVGGSDAFEGQFPFQVSLRKFGFHLCGGSIINQHYVMTAAHCIFNETIWGTDVVSGTNRLRGGPMNIHRAVHFKVHDYNHFTKVNDIGLIKVYPAFEYSDLVQPVMLPIAPEDLPGGSLVTVIGWGRLESRNSASPNTLKKTQITVIDRQKCIQIHEEKNITGFVDQSNICANSLNGRRGTCFGDSGGPLLYNEKVYGIVSKFNNPATKKWNSAKKSYEIDVECAPAEFPGVFTSVSYYFDWIVIQSESTFTVEKKRSGLAPGPPVVNFGVRLYYEEPQVDYQQMLNSIHQQLAQPGQNH